MPHQHAHAPVRHDGTLSRARQVQVSAGFFRQLLALTCLALLLAMSSRGAAAQGSFPTRDPFARLLAKSDAVVMGRVLEAGRRDVPVPGPGNEGIATTELYARIAIEEWVVGEGSDRELEVRVGHYMPRLWIPQGDSRPGDERVLVYMVRVRGEWWLSGEPIRVPDHESVGLEVLTRGAAQQRVAAIKKAAEATSPESLAVQADVVVVGSLERWGEQPFRVICRVERVLSGTLSAREIEVVPQLQGDLRLGPVLLFLKQRQDSRWEPVNNRAGCVYLDMERVARSAAPIESLLARVAKARAERGGRRER